MGITSNPRKESLDEGRVFRANVEFDIPQGSTQYLSYANDYDFYLTLREITIISGTLQYNVVVGSTDIVRGDPIPVYNNNNTVDPAPVSGAKFFKVTSLTLGQGIDPRFLNASNNPSSKNTANDGGGQGMRKLRGAAINSQYEFVLSISALPSNNAPCKGVLSLEWEETPYNRTV